MDKFERGNRVRYVGRDPKYRGKIGFVSDACEDHTYVVFPECILNTKNSALELLDSGLFNLGATETGTLQVAIDEYQSACAEFEAAQLAVEKAKTRIEDARLALKEALS